MCCGAVAASAGMILSFWAQNIAQLTLSLGILYGFGCGVVFTGINVALSQHFDKYAFCLSARIDNDVILHRTLRSAHFTMLAVTRTFLPLLVTENIELSQKN